MPSALAEVDVVERREVDRAAARPRCGRARRRRRWRRRAARRRAGSGCRAAARCSSASSAWCSCSAAPRRRALSSRARSTSAGRSSAVGALHRGGHPLGLGARLVAALDRGVARRTAASPGRRRPGRSPAGPACARRRWRGRAGRGDRASRPGYRRARDGFRPAACPSGRWRGGVIVAGCGGSHIDRREVPPPCPQPLPPSRPTRPASPTSRCSATPSATTSTAPSPPTPTARRWSRCRPGGAGPTRSCATTSTTVALGLLAAGLEQGRPGRDLGAERGRVDAGPVRHRQDRRRSWSTSTRRTARTSWSSCSTRPGSRCWSRRTAFKTSDYAAMIDRGRGRTAPALRQVVLIGTPDWDALVDVRATAATAAELARLQAELSPDDPINIQYTSGTTGFPKGATLSATTTSSTTATSSAGCCGYTAGGPGLHPGALLPLLRHGDGQPRLHHATAPRWSSRRPGFDPKATLHAVAQERCTSLYGVPTMFIAELNDPDFESYDLSSAAHRDHGRLAVPGRGDEAGRRPDGHDRGDHLLRHDRDLAGVHPDPAPTTRWSAGCRRSGGCTRTSRSRSSTRRPG